jgi:glycosyltransferase involved in cell wall biosynthesis
MKVLIDEGLSTLKELGGIGHQSVNLWKSLKKSIDCDITDYQFLKTLPRGVRRAVYLGVTNLDPRLKRYDIIHYENYYVPRFPSSTRKVATIHDLGGLKAPDVYPGWYNAYFKRVLENAVKRAGAVILPSHAVKQELVSTFPGVDASRAHVCHNGIRSAFLETCPSSEELVSMQLRPYSYFLFVGNLDKRKNLAFLLSKFAEARKRRLIAEDTKLVLVGGPGIGFADFQHFISERDHIAHLGRLSDEQLASLYKFCKAFVFPSLYEGFGIPIIEAMSQSAPILISDIPPSLELNLRHNNQCFVFELGRDEMFAEMLSHLDKNFADIRSRLNYGDLSMYTYDRVALEHLKVYTAMLKD